MRLIGLALGIQSMLLAWPAMADDAATATQPAEQPVLIRAAAAARETRDYKVEAVVQGKAPSEAGVPADINAAFSYKIRHRYGRRESDSVLPLEVSLLEGEMTLQGQKLTITPSLYPKLTVLLDREWKITDIFGLSDSQIAGSLPGINYSNLIMLFVLPDAEKPRAIGDTWEATVKLPSYGESYRFVSTLKGRQIINGVNAAIVSQKITRIPKADDGTASMTATAESLFAIDTGKLLKSHVECEVANSALSSTPQQDQRPSRANIKIDISLAM